MPLLILPTTPSSPKSFLLTVSRNPVILLVIRGIRPVSGSFNHLPNGSMTLSLSQLPAFSIQAVTGFMRSCSQPPKRSIMPLILSPSISVKERSSPSFLPKNALVMSFQVSDTAVFRVGQMPPSPRMAFFSGANAEEKASLIAPRAPPVRLPSLSFLPSRLVASGVMMLSLKVSMIFGKKPWSIFTVLP